MSIKNRSNLSALIAIGVTAALTACGGGGGGGSGASGDSQPKNDGVVSGGGSASGGNTAPITQPPTAKSLSLALEALGVAASSVRGTLGAVDPQGLALTYSISSAPQAGTAVVSGSGEVAYSIAGHPRSAADSFTVTVSNGKAQSTAQVSVKIANDPLLDKQWNIQNTGQEAFASARPVATNDMNVAGAWAAGYSGRGIKIGVLDSGLEAAHEDLTANVDLDHSYNFLTGSHDPTYPADRAGLDHGTSVAGIIAARAFNGLGGRGVAYNARLRGYNLLVNDMEFLTPTHMAKALGSDPISADNDVFNLSLQIPTFELLPFSNTYTALTTTALSLRGGLGASIINAAGNDFAILSIDEAYNKEWCGLARYYKVSCGDVASDERRGGTAPIVVGAINADGMHSSYSNTGAGMWIVAPAGERGYNNSYIDAEKAAATDFGAANITTNRSSCANSFSSFKANPLDSKGEHPLAKQCQYTAMMNGTSAATPNTVGVVALMLEANPKLSVRDIKHILAKTARRNDPSWQGVTTTEIVPNQRIVLEQGWTTNAAGWGFSNRYGFGAVDAAAAVAMAKSYSAYLPAAVSATKTFLPNAASADITAYSGKTMTMAFSESFNSVESVVVYLNIAATHILACNQVELTSPAGTKSILLHYGKGFRNSAISNTRIITNAFYGEPVSGNWSLSVYNLCAADKAKTQLSTTAPQLVAIVGH